MSETHVKPEGTLSLQTIAMPADTNWSGDVFGGWIVSQMDLAGAIHAERFSQEAKENHHLVNGEKKP